MNLIDTHTHLYLPEFDKDRQSVVQNAFGAGIVKMLLPNIDSGSVEGMLKLCSEYPDVFYPMMGLHPGSVGDTYINELENVRGLVLKGKYIAIGEIGIDLYWDKTYIKQQFIAFESQIELALELNLPVVIHSRNSFAEIFSILDKYTGTGLKGVFHSFTGGSAELEKINELGFYTGINGIVTFKNSGLDKLVTSIPLNRILLETDSPYLSPVPVRGKRNESLHLIYINDFLARLFAHKPEHFAEITSENARELFKLC